MNMDKTSWTYYITNGVIMCRTIISHLMNIDSVYIYITASEITANYTVNAYIPVLGKFCDLQVIHLR